MRYARVVEGNVREIFETPAGFTLDQCIHPLLAAQFIECSEQVQVHWDYNGVEFTAPPAPAPAPPAPPAAPAPAPEPTAPATPGTP
jgi:hypothetical protein